MEMNKIIWILGIPTEGRSIGTDTVTPFGFASGQALSAAMGGEMLRCAQHDSAVTHTNGWINVFMCMIAPTADYAD